ncbi:TPA: hypothetical protein U1340_001478 [Streptococcus suis]|nr:hypothetical protein [Streptococcus suis]HEM5148594.1 hypothetical protein [Streptococcus suis]HEM5150012.1 hypothetical protein [Streptococcus suis]HEM5205086.1 hypothetical protein [Streptococcus suis]HEM5209475.1 hypothetical protein [Streptococcus suis]
MSGNDQGDYYKKSVSIEPVKVDNNEATWKMTFDTKNWSFDRDTNYPGKPFQIQQSVLIEATSVTDKKLSGK